MPVLLTNILLLFFWLRLLPQRDQKAFFNPYIAGGISLTDRVVRFLQPVLGMLPPYAVSALVLLFLIGFRGILASGIGLQWVESIGLWRFSANTRSPAESLLFSLVSFGWLLHRLWTLEWVVSLLRIRRRVSRAQAALSALAMPVSALPHVARGIFLVLFGAGMSHALARVGLPFIPVEPVGVSRVVVEGVLPAPVLLVMSLSAMVDVLGVASQLVMIFIVLSFIGTILRSQPSMTIGNEGIDLIVGSVFRRPMVAGGFSFAPIVFFIGAGLVHQVVLNALLQQLQRLAG